MKKIMQIILVLALALAGFGVVGASAAPDVVSYTSGVQVVNLDTSFQAQVRLTYYSSATGAQAGYFDDTIPASSSKTYFPLSGAPAGFEGSMVISADRQIAAIANLHSTDAAGLYNASTTGFSGGSSPFNLPLIFCNNYGFDTFFSVQNVGGSPASVTIDYIAGDAGVNGSEATTIQPGASKMFSQAVGSSTVNCSTIGAGVTNTFIGSVKITSSAPVVATAMQINTTTFKNMMGYNGFTSGSPTVSLPLVMANNYGFYTGISIQNVGTVQTTVTVDYQANLAGPFNPANENCVLDPGEACALVQLYNGVNQWNQTYVGSANITNSASQNLVAVVNQNSQAGPLGGPFGTAYEGANPAAATGNVTFPLLYANNWGWYTSFQIQNVGNSTCPSITVDYGPNVAVGGTYNPVNETKTNLAAGSGWTVLQSGTSPGNGSANNWATAGIYVGSAEVSAPGCKLVAIVNQQKLYDAADKFMTYVGLNH